MNLITAKRPKISGALATLAVLASLAIPGPPAFPSDWVGAAKSQARLIQAPATESKDGVWLAAAQIRLAGPALTYWRAPGDAGAPPVWSFDGSANLAKAEVLYPQPERIDEGGTQVFGYREQVIFPIAVTPRDAGQPVHVQLGLDYAVCDKLCLPVHAQMQIDLPAGALPEDAELVAKALREVPRQLSPTQVAAQVEITRVEGAQGQWRLRWRPDQPVEAARDLFAEAPSGFYVETKALGDNLFLLTLVEHPANKITPPSPLRLTLTGQRPAEFYMNLP